MDITVVRPFGIYGPGQKNKLVPTLLDSLLEGREVYIERNPTDSNDLNGLVVSLCYIDDAVEIFHNLLFQNGVPYVNLAGDKAVSIREIVTLMASHLGKDLMLRVSDEYRDSNLIADISLLKETLNPRFTGIGTGLRRVLDQVLNTVTDSGQQSL